MPALSQYITQLLNKMIITRDVVFTVMALEISLEETMSKTMTTGLQDRSHSYIYLHIYFWATGARGGVSYDPHIQPLSGEGGRAQDWHACVYIYMYIWGRDVFLGGGLIVADIHTRAEGAISLSQSPAG